MCNHFRYWNFVNPFHFLCIHSKLNKTKKPHKQRGQFYLILNSENWEAAFQFAYSWIKKYLKINSALWQLWNDDYSLWCILTYKTTVSILNYRACTFEVDKQTITCWTQLGEFLHIKRKHVTYDCILLMVKYFRWILYHLLEHNFYICFQLRFCQGRAMYILYQYNYTFPGLPRYFCSKTTLAIYIRSHTPSFYFCCWMCLACKISSIFPSIKRL